METAPALMIDVFICAIVREDVHHVPKAKKIEEALCNTTNTYLFHVPRSSHSRSAIVRL